MLSVVLVRKVRVPRKWEQWQGVPFLVERVHRPPAPTCASRPLVSNNRGFEHFQRLLGFLEPPERVRLDEWRVGIGSDAVTLD